mgnify:CR=1 FL=1
MLDEFDDATGELVLAIADAVVGAIIVAILFLLQIYEYIMNDITDVVIRINRAFKKEYCISTNQNNTKFYAACCLLLCSIHLIVK